MRRIATGKVARKPALAAMAGMARSGIASVSSHSIFPLEESDFLTRSIPFIQILLRKQASSGSEEDREDVSQEVLIALWLKVFPRIKDFTSPEAYISRIVHSRWIDAARKRQRKPAQSLFGEDGEYSPEVLRSFSNEGAADPALEYERQELIEEVIEEVAQLPSIQMKAMVCTLRDEIGNMFPLGEAFAKYDIDIRMIAWPDDSSERRSWLSSLSVARKKLCALKQKRARF
ncbi:MAG TPA: sigma factor [Ktedonobacteraceae bacterium]|nr:sigma factor [Ktedonobacteraceae bacterium]